MAREFARVSPGWKDGLLSHRRPNTHHAHGVIGLQQFHGFIRVDLAALPPLQYALSEEADSSALHHDVQRPWVICHATMNAGRVPAAHRLPALRGAPEIHYARPM